MIAQVGYSVVGWSRGRVTSCAVCTMHIEMRSACFLVEPQNQGRWFVSGLTSKPLGRFSLVWLQNWWRRFLPVWPQNRWLRFPSLGLKTGSYGLEIWASKSPQRFLDLGLKTKQATIYRLCHKTDGSSTAWGTRRDLADYFAWKQVGLGFFSLASRLMETRWRVVHVAPSWRLHQSQVEDGRIDAMGCVGLYYHCYVIFFLLYPRVIVII
jgi:hypothetical protein